MKNKNLKLPIIIIAIGIIIAIAAGLLASIQKTPTITNQDFDFSITYKLDGETKTLNGVYSSHFTGFGGNGVDPFADITRVHIKSKERTTVTVALQSTKRMGTNFILLHF